MTRGKTMPEAQTFAKARKVSVVAMVERGGRVRAYVQPREGALQRSACTWTPRRPVYTDESAGSADTASTQAQRRGWDPTIFSRPV